MSGERSRPPNGSSTGQSWSKHSQADAGASSLPGVRAGCEAILLESRGDSAVLLLHGFGDTPQTFCYLAPALHAAGFAVHAPLLPGHGTSIEDFARTSAADWVEASRAALRSVSERYDNVGIAGLSMGGALAILVAAESRDVGAVVLMAPYVVMPPTLAAASAVHRVWGGFAGTLTAQSNTSIRDPLERARNLGYGQTNARLLNELWRLGRRARRALPSVTAPTLIIQSREDNRIRPRIAQRVLARLGSTEKRLILTAGAGHIITVDHGYAAVVEEVRDWFAAHLGANARSAK
jgi:carboxylesterase